MLTLCLWGCYVNTENRYIEPILCVCICVKLSMVIQCYNLTQTQELALVWMRLNNSASERGMWICITWLSNIIWSGFKREALFTYKKTCLEWGHRGWIDRAGWCKDNLWENYQQQTANPIEIIVNWQHWPSVSSVFHPLVFCPKILGRLQRLMNLLCQSLSAVSVVSPSIGDWDTKTLSVVIDFIWTVTLRGSRNAKTYSLYPSCPTSYLVKFYNVYRRQQ